MRTHPAWTILATLISTHLVLGQLVISEFMADNSSTLADEDGEFSDWIEIANPTAAPIDLAGWSLTDDPSRPQKWVFPAQTLPARSHLVVFASNKNRRLPGAELHTNFRLSAEGESLHLHRPDGSPASVIPAYPAQVPDVAYGFPVSNQVTQVVGPTSVGRLRVPTDATEDATWTQPLFADTSWQSSGSGIGFETGSPEFGPGLPGDLLDHNPTGYWRMEEQAENGLTAYNTVPGGDVGQYKNGVGQNVNTLQAPTYPGYETDNQGARFDGVNDMMEVPYAAGLNTASYSFSAWFKVAGGAAHRAVISSRDDVPARGYILYVEPGGTVSFWSGTGAGWHTLTGPVATVGAWYHVAGTYDSTTQTKRLYLNGAQIQQATGVLQALNTSRPLRIGAGRNETAGDYWFNGDIDEPAVWNRALSATEIADHYNAALTGADAAGVLLAQAPAGYWRLRDPTAAVAVTALNLGSSGSAGVLTGGVTTGLPGPRPAAQAGYPADNRAFRFDGATGKVDVPYHASHNPAFFTVECWVRCTGGTGTFRAPLSSRDDLPQRGYTFYAGTDNLWQFWTGTGVQAQWQVQRGPAVALNAWTHLAGTFDGATKRFYVNGSLVAEGATVIGPNSARPLRIGAGANETAGGFWFPGEVDEVAVIPRVLSGAEIADRHARALNGSGQNDYGTWITTDVETSMHGVRGTAYLRLPFTVADPGSLDALTLRMRYDDGFALWLNGVPVASANSPALPAWDSVATARNPNHEAVRPESFDLSGHLDSLVAGTNVLAVQALNLEAANPDLLSAPVLESVETSFNTAQPVYFAQATPGQPNAPGSANPGPLLVDAAHLPSVLPETSNLTVTVRALPTLGAVTNVTLRWRVNFGTEIPVPMADDGLHGDGLAGDGTYGAVIDAENYGPAQMVRWRFTAADASNRTSRLPLFADPLGSPEYHGTMTADTTGFTTALPVWYWFAATPADADTRLGTRGAVFFNGKLHDNIFIRLRGGATSANSRKYDFNSGDHCLINPEVGRVEEANLNGSNLDPALVRPSLAFEVFRNAGHAAGHAFPLIQRLNGGPDRVSYFVEQVDERLLDRVGYDREGALYKMDQRADLNPCFHDTTDGVEKKTRLTENRADLQVLVDTVKNLSDPALRSRRMHDQVDLANLVNYLACRAVVNEFDDVRKNFYMYRDTLDTGEWRVIPWDKDGTFGIVGDSGPNLPHPFWGDQAHLKANANQWCYLWEAAHTDARISRMYLRRLRTVMDQQLQEAPGYLEARAASWFAPVSPHLPGQNISDITNWLPTRRTQLYTTYTAPDSVAPGLAIPPAQDPAITIGFGILDFNPASGNQAEEYIQLVNTNGVAVDISGWQLRGGVEHTFDAGTVLLPTNTMYVANRAAAFRSRAISPKGGETLYVQGNYDGTLSARGETLRLIDPGATTNLVDDRLVAEWTYPGAPTPAQSALRITELMYHPADGGAFAAEEYEYLELQNIGATHLDLTGATFTHGITFTFGSTNLAAGAHLVLVKNPAAFAARYGGAVTPAGTYFGSLDNAGERLRIVDGVGEEVLDFTYADTWQPLTDGGGYALVVDSPATAAWDTYSTNTTWRTSATVNGSPALPDPGHAVPERPGQLTVDRHGNGVNLTFLGAFNHGYHVERSTNLVDWLEIAAPVTSPSGRIDLPDTPPDIDRAYYRVREP
jgi:hypothetical protein